MVRDNNRPWRLVPHLAGDNQSEEFRERMRQFAQTGPDMPRHIYSDRSYFELIE